MNFTLEDGQQISVHWVYRSGALVLVSERLATLTEFRELQADQGGTIKPCLCGHYWRGCEQLSDTDQVLEVL